MLFVLFHLGQERYALEAARVVEVVPLLALKRFPQSPRGVAGIFIYRGRPVPALDLCELTVGRPAQENFSTRIILINHGNKPGDQQLVGLIAERVTETLRREESEFLDPGMQLASSPFLGPVLMDDRGVVQVVNPERLMVGGELIVDGGKLMVGNAKAAPGHQPSTINYQPTKEALDASH